jgi:protein ImuB
MSLFLPHWPIECSRNRNARSDKPFVFVTALAGRRVITAANATAASEGIAPGMGLSDARMLRPDLDAAMADFPGDAAALARLARWCNRFSPWTAPHGSDGIFLDVTGCAHLFGGEAGLAEQVIARLAHQGVTGRVAIATTLGAAWAMSRFGPKPAAVIPPHETHRALADLPVAALRLEPPIITLLAELGLRRIGELTALPRAALVARCGESAALRLDQASGLAPEPLSPLPPKKRPWLRRSFAEPLLRTEDIAMATRTVLEEFCRHLAKENLGVRKLALMLYRVDNRIEEAAIGTAMPSRDPRHLWRLLEERLPYLDPGLGIEDLVLMAPETEALAPLQPGFAGGVASSGAGEAADLAALIDRLSQRLGVEAVVRPRLQESHLPERAVRFLPAFHHGAARAVLSSGKRRPIRLLRRPEPIEAMALVPDDPPLLFRWRGRAHHVRRADGPERIAAEWWREVAEPRDYYRVEDEDGRRFWLYRSGLYRPEIRPHWFLHGFFG